MDNATIYCLCLHNKVLPVIKKLGYVPVGLGNDKFSKEWIRDNTLKISLTKINIIVSILFIIGFGKISSQKLRIIIG